MEEQKRKAKKKEGVARLMELAGTKKGGIAVQELVANTNGTHAVHHFLVW